MSWKALHSWKRRVTSTGIVLFVGLNLWCSSPAEGASPVTHIVLIDISGSMRGFLNDNSIREWVYRGLLTNPDVILPGDRLIVRGFNVQPEPIIYSIDDHLRLWPQGTEPQQFRNADEVQRAADSVMSHLEVSQRDTDLFQALRYALLDWTEMVEQSTTIIWILTDNWQDVQGSNIGIEQFYEKLATDNYIRAVSILPLIKELHDIESNMVLYGALLTHETGEQCVYDYEEKITLIAEGSHGFGFIEDSLQPISCRGSQLSPPVMEGVSYEAGSGSEAEFLYSTGQIIFNDVRLGQPLTGRLQFQLRSTSTQWRIRNARVTALSFSSFSCQGGELYLPEVVHVRVTPPILEDVGPGELSAARFHGEFPQEGLIQPRLRKRKIQHYFPGSEVRIEGRVRLGIEVDLAKGHLLLNDSRLSELVTQVRMIDGIERMITSGGGNEPVLLSKSYPVKIEIKVNDFWAWFGLIILIVILLCTIGVVILVILPSSIIVTTPAGEEVVLQVSILRPAVVRINDTAVGEVKKLLNNSLWFYPIVRDSMSTQQEKFVLSDTQQEVLVSITKDEYSKILIGKSTLR